LNGLLTNSFDCTIFTFTKAGLFLEDKKDALFQSAHSEEKKTLCEHVIKHCNRLVKGLLSNIKARHEEISLTHWDHFRYPKTIMAWEAISSNYKEKA